MKRVWLAIRRRLGLAPYPSAVWDDEPFDDFDPNSANETKAGNPGGVA